MPHNLNIIDNELKKLINIDKHIDVNIINEIICDYNEYNFFEFCESLLKQKIEVIKIYDNYIVNNIDINYIN